MFQILVVEDDSELRRLFITVLNKNGYKAIGAANGIEALDVLENNFIDLIIADIMMPLMDGNALVRQLRQARILIPILIITAKDTLSDKQRGFEAGADDYMVKPVDVNEMVIRVGALLRRAHITSARRLTVNNTVLDYDSFTAEQNGVVSELPQKEFMLLYKLLSSPGRIFTRQQLMDEIWGMDSMTDARTVDVHINRLRDRFKDCDDFSIVTVRGLGYKAVTEK